MLHEIGPGAIKQELGHSPPPMEPKAHIISISDVSSFSTVSILSCYPIREVALCVEEPQLGWISSPKTRRSPKSHSFHDITGTPTPVGQCAPTAMKDQLIGKAEKHREKTVWQEQDPYNYVSDTPKNI